jgi:hypothetical protein
MQQLIGILLIIFGIRFFLFARDNHTFDSKDYNTITTVKRYSTSFLMILLGIIILLGGW